MAAGMPTMEQQTLGLSCPEDATLDIHAYLDQDIFSERDKANFMLNGSICSRLQLKTSRKIFNNKDAISKLKDPKKTTDESLFASNSYETVDKYCHKRRIGEALEMLETVANASVYVSPKMLIHLFHGCSIMKEVIAVKHAYCAAAKCGYETDNFVGTQFIQVLTVLGNLSEAVRMFNKLHVPNEFSWTAIIRAYTKLAVNAQAIELYHKMSIHCNGHAFVVVLNACSSITNLNEGKHVHDCVVESGLESVAFVGDAIVSMYSRCGSLRDAYIAFERLPYRDINTWTILMAGYVQHGSVEEAFKLLDEMVACGIKPRLDTYANILKACSKAGTLGLGTSVHACIVQSGFEQDVYVGGSLVDMYVKCASLCNACLVFDKLHRRDVVTWTAMIAGFAQQGDEMTLHLYMQMQLEGIQPNIVTLLPLLKACSLSGTLGQGKMVHHNIIESHIEMHPTIITSIIDMYVKCASLEDAQSVFIVSPKRSIEIWSCLIAGYIEHSCSQDALQLFRQMCLDGLKPDQVTFLSVLKACGNIGALEHGKQAHLQIIQSGIEEDMSIGSALVHMYCKCGSISNALTTFHRLSSRNVVVFNLLIEGLARHRYHKLAFKCFEDMQEVGCNPDNVTYLSLLCACMTSLLIENGCHLFKSMQARHGILPTCEHFNAMVAMLGESGYLEEAEDLLETIPFQPNFVGWISLLNSCKMLTSVEMGKRCFAHTSALQPMNGSSYALMSNIYLNAGMKDNAAKLEKVRKHLNVWKRPGEAYVEVNFKVHIFLVGETSHPQRQNILAKLRELENRMRQEGYLSIQDGVMQGGEDPNDLCGHCERLAVGLGLISTAQGKTIRVLKNLRVCANCHYVITAISKLEGRKIILIDAFCVHKFENGACSCHMHR